jgi:hypothetical protein
VESIRESLVCNVEGYSSASQALKLARRIGLTSKLKPAFVSDSYSVVLLRHYVTRIKLVVPRKSGRLGSGIRYLIATQRRKRGAGGTTGSPSLTATAVM